MKLIALLNDEVVAPRCFGPICMSCATDGYESCHNEHISDDAQSDPTRP